MIRAKGVCYFAHNRDMSFLFEQAGSQKQLSEAGLWYATAPENELAEMMKQEPGLARDWDEKYGDRMQKSCLSVSISTKRNLPTTLTSVSKNRI